MRYNFNKRTGKFFMARMAKLNSFELKLENIDKTFAKINQTFDRINKHLDALERSFKIGIIFLSFELIIADIILVFFLK